MKYTMDVIPLKSTSPVEIPAVALSKNVSSETPKQRNVNKAKYKKENVNEKNEGITIKATIVKIRAISEIFVA